MNSNHQKPELLSRVARSGAFTITELLVAVAIISVLAAMIMAGLSKAREKGRAAVCLNNLRQLSTLVFIYTDENSGFVPRITADAGIGDDDQTALSAANGGGSGSSGGGLNCTPDASGRTWICHVPPGNPADAHCNYVGFPSLGGHQNHGSDYCGACAGMTCIANALGHLNALFGTGKGLALAKCPSDLTPEYQSLVDQSGTPRYVPISYIENMEYSLTSYRLDVVRKPAEKLLLLDGKPSATQGQYLISNYNTTYAVFRHLGRVNTVFGDGHAESVLKIRDSQILLD